MWEEDDQQRRVETVEEICNHPELVTYASLEGETVPNVGS